MKGRGHRSVRYLWHALANRLASDRSKFRMRPPPDIVLQGWIRALRSGEHEPVQDLWNAYFGRLIRLSWQHLRSRASTRPTREDCEDVAITAFTSFCRSASAGMFPWVSCHHDLWLALKVVTRRKVANHLEREGRFKRGKEWNRLQLPLDAIHGREPSPEENASAADMFHTLLARIEDDQLRAAAALRLEGRTVSEVAEFLGCSVPTIERRLRVLRHEADKLWGSLAEGMTIGRPASY